MEFILSVITVLFVILLIATALTFGFALFTVLLGVAVLSTFALVMHRAWIRWSFIHRAVRNEQTSRQDSQIIEVEYEDISNHKP